MRRRTQAGLVAITAVAGMMGTAGPVAAGDCVTDYMRCAASMVPGDSDDLHDDYCDRDYLRCVGTLLRFY